MNWSVVYEKAIRDDGSLYFPERLTKEFLDQIRRSMGVYQFANQYQNEIVPDGEQPFKKNWIKYYTELPKTKHTFAFIDPALSQESMSDYTALVIIDVDHLNQWYLRVAQRYRITPTQIVTLVFKVIDQFQPMCIGIEDVAYQKALLYMLDEESRRRNKVVPVKGIKPSTEKTKETRILGLVPRFEWNRIFISKGLYDFELEYAQFPRSAHDDLMDALAYMETIVVYPVKKEEVLNEPSSAAHPDYEKWYIHQLPKRANEHTERSGDDD